MTNNEKNRKSELIIDQASDWFARLQSDTTSHVDHRMFHHWIDANPEHRLAYKKITELWETIPKISDWTPVNQVDTKNIITTTPKTNWLQSPLSFKHCFATAALLLISTSIIYFFNRAEFHETGVGEQKLITLEDGTALHINTRSKIDIRLTKQHRLLKLHSGEALFNVAHDKNRPFLVDIGGVCVQAVGTAFNIYKDSKTSNTTVTVVKGDVLVSQQDFCGVETENSPNNTVRFLTASEQISIKQDHSLSDIRRIDSQNSITWTTQKLVYEGVPLQEVLVDINRYTKDEIRVATDEIRQLRVSGVLRIQNQETIVKSLESAFGLEALRISKGVLELRKAYFRS